MTTQRSRFLLASMALAVALTTGACAAGDSMTSSEDSGGVAEPAADAPAAATDGGGDDAGQTDDRAMDRSGLAGEGVEPRTPAVIATGTVSLEADDVGDARFDVQKIVDRAGGSVVEQETTTDDDGELDTARIVLRVPSERFAETLDALERVGSLQSSTTGTDDVTTEVIDVDARIRAQEKSVRRIEALLARATTLREIIAIEADLSQRQADLDSLKSRQQWLEDQTARSTITVHLERTDDEEEEETADGFLGGLRAGWDRFVDGGAAALTVIGFVLPWAIALAVILVPALLWLRASRRRRTPLTTAGPQ
ncbi:MULTISPECIES: DUF4349 domain-containing protein [Nocardioides]|uniref:DUF4349 domain-containing protein n=1 Tax=Nocardioides vastitatis TaxID=2568655 RepID=A0ABW0ZCU4_9ACTN|nr:DUF4349 domain-containing protein [Nocardioides sp.]THJ10115.1 DUF4349 domain-containing protein [Nocardioides sp.]